MRLPSHKVLYQADAKPVEIGELLKSDGRWRIMVFAGDLREESQFNRVQRLGEALDQPQSLLYKYTPAGQPLDSIFEVF